jgi:hypothetical protein
MKDALEPIPGAGYRDIKRAEPRGEPVFINGYATPPNQAPKVLTVGGYALTTRVDADFMREWLQHNAGHPAVKANLIYIHSRQSMVEGWAKEHASTRSGLEPIDPAKHLPKGIQTADRQAA